MKTFLVLGIAIPGTAVMVLVMGLVIVSLLALGIIIVIARYGPR